MKSSPRIHFLILIICACVLGSTAQGVGTGQGGRKGPGPIVVSVDAGGRFKLGNRAVTLSRLGSSLSAALDARTPADRIIWVKAAPNVPFSQIIKLLKLGRTIKEDSFGLIPDTENVAGAVITKIALDSRDDSKPNPLYLGLTFKKNGRMSLNGEPHTPLSLTTKLREIFKSRADNGVFREGTNEVERSIFLVPSRTTTYGAIIKAARLAKGAGAEPIGIEIDGPRPMVTRINTIQP